MTVHVAADDIHLVRTGRADLRTVHLLARARSRRLRVQRPEARVGLAERVVVHAGARAVPANATATGGNSATLRGRASSSQRCAVSRRHRPGLLLLLRVRLIVVLDALGVRAAVALELG